MTLTDETLRPGDALVVVDVQKDFRPGGALAIDGASFHPELRLPESTVKITKGVRFDQDQNSVFDQTGLATRLRQDGVKRLFVGGLAEDVCVLASVLDGRRAGFDVVLIPDATRPVTVGGGEKARREMRDAGAKL